MERQIIIRNRQRALAGDIMDMQSGLRATIDELVREAVGSGRYYTGYSAGGSLFELTLQPGRVWIDGAMYQSLSSTVFAQELFNARPLAQQRIVAVVGWGQEIETTESGAAAEPRQFAVDVVSNQYEVQQVTTRKVRRAEINLVSGVEAAQPVVPAIPGNTVLIATVLLSNSGIVSVTMNEEGLLPQGERNALAIGVLQQFLETQATRIDTLVTDLAAIRSNLEDLATKSALASVRMLAEDALRRANEAYSLASNDADFLRDFEDRYVDDGLSDVEHSGYSAVVDRGLKFPPAASASLTNGIELFNALDARVKVHDDLILPAYSHVLRIDTFGRGKVAAQAALQSYTTATHTIQATVPAKSEVVYAKSSVYSFYITLGLGESIHGVTFPSPDGTMKPIPLNSTTRAWALKELGSATGHSVPERRGTPGFDVVSLHGIRRGSRVQVKVSYQYEAESAIAAPGKPAYEQVTTTTTYDGQGRANTWLQERTGWMTRVGLFFTSRGASGDVRLLVLAVDKSGAPDLRQAPVNVTVPWASIKAAPISTGSPDEIETIVDIPPVLLQGGRRYAIAVLSSGDHSVRLATSVGAMTQGAHWALSDAGKWVRIIADPDQDMAFRLYFARFPTTSVAVDLKPLSLAGGIHEVAISAQMITPDLTELAFEVQPDGTNWRVLGPPSGQRVAADLSEGPELLPFRVVFEGTHDIMPALSRGSSKSTVTSSRPAGALEHYSELIDVGSGNTANRIKVMHILSGFDDGDHDFTVSLITDPLGTPATEAADAVTDTVLDDETISRTSVFELDAGKQVFQIKAVGANNGALKDLYSVAGVYAAFYDAA